MWIICRGVGSMDSQEITHTTVHGSSKLRPSIAVQVEWCAMFVNPLVHHDVGYYHDPFSGYSSAFDPFGKVVLHHDNILIPAFCPVERSYQVDRHSLIEGSMFGLLEFTVASHGGFAASASCASLTPRFHVLLHSWPVELPFY